MDIEMCLGLQQHSDVSFARCVAGSDLPKDLYCGPVPDLNFMNGDVESSELTRPVKVFAKGNFMHVIDTTATSWTSLLHPARDVHEQNIQIFRSRDMAFYIRTTRDIPRGQILRCWFEESLALEKKVPYLIPANILGSQKYMCTRCQRAFAYPNLLKLHLMHDCPSQDLDLVAVTGVQENVSSRTKQCVQPVDFSNAQFPKCQKDIGLKYYNLNIASGLHKSLQTSEYKTVDSRTALISGNQSSMFNFDNLSQFDFNTKERALDTHYDVTHDVNDKEYAEEEPMDVLSKSFLEFSSKDGHLCIYCGKFYSRKYGLKIHLRTHTGFKPLKCKVCFRAFGDPSNLNKHIRLHAEGSAPYPCVHCGKVLMRRRDLTRHIKSRHPARCINK